MEGFGSFALYTAGIAGTFQPDVLLMLVMGTTIGVVFGVVPGLSPTIGIAILTPLTFSMSTEAAFAVLLGVYTGATYGGSISAILVNIPGTIAAIMTAQDGFPLSQRGEAARAIALATASSFIGGLFSVLALSFLAPAIARFAISLSAQEYFAICLFGLSVIAYISGPSLLKGGISAILGLLLATIGLDPTSAYPRFTFGNTNLLGGINMIALMVGVLGFAEVLRLVEETNPPVRKAAKIDRVRPSLTELWRMRFTLLRGSSIGVFIGAMPASGGALASIIAYGLEKRISSHPETYGKGELRGIAAPESANNAATGGAMIPMMTLGIPGDIVTAILIGALVLHGLQPGPLLFRDHPDIVSSIFILMMLSNVVFLFLGLLGARYFVRVISLPRHTLIALILCLSVVGTYSIQNNLFDVWVLLFGGIAGFVLTKVGLPVAPLVLGFILGPIVETYFRQALILSYGDPMEFVARPVSATFIVLTVLVILAPYLLTLFGKLFPGLVRPASAQTSDSSQKKAE